MKRKTLRFLAAMAVTAVTFAASAMPASAVIGPRIGIDPDGFGPLGFYYADLWTNLTDSGLSYTFDPSKRVPVPDAPYSTTFLYQARIGTLQLGGAPVIVPGLNATRELTLTLSTPETVVNQGTYTDGLGRLHEFATFSTGPDPLALANLYLDNSGVLANPNVVSGYNNGTNILTAHVNSLNATFDAVRTGTGAGTGTGSFDVQFLIDSFNPLYVDISNLGIPLFDVHSTGTLNTPTFFHPTTMWDGTSTSPRAVYPNTPGRVLLKVDASESFSASAIPEPSTMMLMGSGILGLAGYGFTRRWNKE